MSLGDENLDRWGIAKDVAGLLTLETDKNADTEKVIEARKRKFFLKDHQFDAAGKDKAM